MSKVQISGEGDSDPTRIRFIGHLDARIRIENPPGMQWVFVNDFRCAMTGFSREEIVEKPIIVEGVRRSLEPVLRRLNKLAGECGPQCNEHEPLKAVAILQRQVDEIKKAVHDALTAL